MKLKNRFCQALILIALTAMAGCSRPDNTAELWTNIPEIAAYAEEFNAGQDEFRVKIVYKENPGKELLAQNVIPDLVLAQGLNSVRFTALLEDLSPSSDPEKGVLSSDIFYSDLFDSGLRGEILQALPVSFNLSALYHKEGAIPEGEEKRFYSPEDLQRFNASFNETSKGSFPVIGFSPRWDGHYLYGLSVLSGSNFHETAGETIGWSSDALTAVRDLARHWTDEVNTGYDDELHFTKKYLYQPGNKLVHNGRVQFQTTTIKEFYSIPALEREDINLLWISDGSRVPVCSDVLYAGIPKQGEDRRAARAFLAWFFQEETQGNLLKSSQFKRIRGFGIAQGLSSLIHVNELNLPEYYPILVGKIPSEAELIFPSVLPVEWDRVRKEVVIPWLLEDSTPGGAEKDLAAALEAWYQQNPTERH